MKQKKVKFSELKVGDSVYVFNGIENGISVETVKEIRPSEFRKNMCYVITNMNTHTVRSNWSKQTNSVSAECQMNLYTDKMEMLMDLQKTIHYYKQQAEELENLITSFMKHF